MVFHWRDDKNWYDESIKDRGDRISRIENDVNVTIREVEKNTKQSMKQNKHLND